MSLAACAASKFGRRSAKLVRVAKRGINRPFGALRKVPAVKEVSGSDAARPDPPRSGDPLTPEGTFAMLVGDVAALPKAADRTPPSRPGEGPRRLPKRRFFVQEDGAWVAGRREDVAGGVLRNLQGRQMLGGKLDLHRLTVERARAEVTRFIEACGKGNARVVLIIVGKGERHGATLSTLREHVVSWLSAPPCVSHVRAFASADRSDGGAGAIYVALEP